MRIALWLTMMSQMDSKSARRDLRKKLMDQLSALPPSDSEPEPEEPPKKQLGQRFQVDEERDGDSDRDAWIAAHMIESDEEDQDQPSDDQAAAESSSE